MKKIVFLLFATMTISSISAQQLTEVTDNCDEVVTELKGEIFYGYELGMTWTFDTGSGGISVGPGLIVYEVEVETGYMDGSGNMIWGGTTSYTIIRSDTNGRPDFSAYVGQRTSYARFRVKIVNEDDCNPWSGWKVVS